MKKIINIFLYINASFNFQQKRLILLTVLVSFLSSVVISVSPAVLSLIINKLTTLNNVDVSYTVLLLSIGYIIILAIGRILPICFNAMMMLLQVDRQLVLSHSFMKYLYKQNMDFFTKNNGGVIAQQSVQLNNEMHLLFNVFINGFFDPLCRLIIAILMILIGGDLVVFLFFLVYIVVSFNATGYFTKKLVTFKNDLMDCGRNSYKIKIDSVENIVLAKHNNTFGFLFSRYKNVLDKEKESAVNYAKWTNYMTFFNASLSILLFGSCFIYTLYMVVEKGYTLGYFVMISSYIMMLSQPIEGLSNNYSRMQQALNFLNDFIEKFRQTEKHVQNDLVDKERDLSVDIENLSFSYPNTDKKILTDINLHLPCGDFIAFTGASGSGKTTLVKLLTGHYSGYQGVIKVNGRNIEACSDSYLNDRICFVSQDEFIFMDSLRFNLLIAKPEATDEELLQALSLANFSMQDGRTPDKTLLDMHLGNKGTTVSGGQRQRISLARLFLRNPALIIIDESTSALDLINEKIILENIITCFPQATKISISHRPTTFSYSDKIYVFEEGRIVDQGDLAELLQRNAYIREINQRI